VQVQRGVKENVTINGQVVVRIFEGRLLNPQEHKGPAYERGSGEFFFNRIVNVRKKMKAGSLLIGFICNHTQSYNHRVLFIPYPV